MGTIPFSSFHSQIKLSYITVKRRFLAFVGGPKKAMDGKTTDA
jgi:hypothetical protein